MNRTIKPVQFPARQPKLLRVAAYARVSTGKDAMLHSLSAQVSFYSSLIQSHGDWLYAGVYTDEAVTGTKGQRNGFQRMLADCCAGKIDMVMTKSISRFARNTVTLLKTVRELKALGVDVFFEEQNLHTMSADGELNLWLVLLCLLFQPQTLFTLGFQVCCQPDERIRIEQRLLHLFRCQIPAVFANTGENLACHPLSEWLCLRLVRPENHIV